MITAFFEYALMIYDLRLFKSLAANTVDLFDRYNEDETSKSQILHICGTESEKGGDESPPLLNRSSS